MLVNTGSGVAWEKITHPMHKTANWCIGEAGSLWPIIISVVRFWFSVRVSSDSWASYYLKTSKLVLKFISQTLKPILISYIGFKVWEMNSRTKIKTDLKMELKDRTSLLNWT